MRNPDGVHLASTFLLLLVLLIGPVAATIPYTPSYLLYDLQNNASFTYLLRPGSTQGTTELLSLNVSRNIDGSNPRYKTLSEEVPFDTENQTSSFVPVIDQHGVIKTYAGNCNCARENATVWQFTPSSGSATGNGTWERYSVDATSDPASSGIHGPNYLSAGFAYASSNTSDSAIYVFGGMCPLPNEWGPTWMAAANYSRAMVVLNPPKSDNPSSYQISAAGDRAPPIPEAGFTITPLLPAYAATPMGKLLKQQDFLLIGGHTQKAFINMSQLALFSLPQKSWSIVHVGSSLGELKTDLAARNSPAIDPRSGHTAVLSPDGRKVIVLGGWVGNTGVPANPQLAVLEIGDDSTGSDGWKWSIPSQKHSPIAEGTGIYGHGVTMLPGGVMMIAGGYRIPQSSKRSAAGPQLNTQVQLYNVTSGSWVSSYKNPNYVSNQPTSDEPSDPETNTDPVSHSSTSRTIGLGAGLGAGIPTLAGAAILVWFYWRRRRTRRARDQSLRKLALDAQRAHFWGQDDPSMASSIRRPSMRETNRDYPWNNNQGTGRSSSWPDSGDAAAERTGLLMDIPTPTKTIRSGLNARMYRPPAPYNEYRRSDGTAEIHPIDEREEDEIQDPEQRAARESMDPFLTPRSTIVGEEQLYPNGVVPVLAPSAGLGHDEPSSPDKNDRTSSNLSDSSTEARSAHQYHGVLFSNSSSQPSSGRVSPEKPGSSSGHSSHTPQHRPDSATIPQEKRYSSDSFSTAHTTLSQRQVEGEHLLQEGPQSPTGDLFPRPLSISKPRTSDWMGNVRRVLSVTRKRPPANDDWNDTSMASGVDRMGTVLGAPKALPESSGSNSQVPRRSVSASAELFRRKQGPRNWSAGNRVSRDMTSQTPIRDDFALDGLLDMMEGHDDSDSDSDLEGATEGRRVQMTYTAPKERLRVVNATARDMDNFSEKSISRSNSEA
ncbi:hypothetical protein P170DRAFT_362646 [Aspergillus steynii IBT 23096]|uniref:Galactose oxidase n=1 Tax=Aspergillus steynii IBT 23096 TaxID=1392250 RepID=A0A2I2G212_9EURO|nr:uncharacterized protein P170DRAFT_362646 [Aspergillus steynii IBT 23096]PLB46930.1 hypothetical protein P170DRAFT_362646 [Aspergillus steynii IBT 23096]